MSQPEKEKRYEEKISELVMENLSLRQLLKEYRENHSFDLCNNRFYAGDQRCSVCRKHDALEGK